jgi:pimeloyl-ACP methyl ester carboxylesterase
MVEGAGHFPWHDAPDRYWSAVGSFLAAVGETSADPTAALA